MSAWKLYGPDGQPMVVAGPEGQPHRITDVAKARSSGALERVNGPVVDERAYMREVQKRVRSQAVTFTVAGTREQGRPKPTPVTFDTLRLMARRNEWVRAIINKRKSQIAGRKWSITLKDTDDPSGAASKAAKAVTKLLERPMMHGSAPRSTHWQQVIGMFIEDLLQLDRACWEKERDGNGWIVALYPVDGATINPVLDERGQFYDDAYVQIVDGRPEARFGMEELVVAMMHEQTDVRMAGYGFSPLEAVITSVTADLYAAKFNASYFEAGQVPDGILDLGEDVNPEDVDAFRLYWLTEIAGRAHSLPIIGGSKAPQFIQWRESNRDMQFMEYQQWLLQKLTAAFGMTPKDLGSIDDVNRSTAEDASASDETDSVQPLADFIANVINLEIVGEHGQGLGDYLEFAWEQAGESADQINQKFQPMHQAGVATGAEWRDAHGMDADGDPKATHGQDALRMHLKDGQPLPSKEDVQHMGAAAERQQAQEDQQQQWARDDVTGDRDHQRQLEQSDTGGPAAQVPWKPGDPDDKDLKSAMDDHDRDSGIGPRNVGKTDATGHDRHPALTRETDSLDDVFATATERLADVLAGIVR